MQLIIHLILTPKTLKSCTENILQNHKSKMEHFVIIVNGWKPLTIITKSSILDAAAVLDPPMQKTKLHFWLLIQHFHQIILYIFEIIYWKKHNGQSRGLTKKLETKHCSMKLIEHQQRYLRYHQERLINMST